MKLMTYLFLCLAIVSEVVATTALKLSESFTRLVPSVVTVVFYAIAFYCLTISMRVLPTGVIYAIWSGVGIVLIAAVSWIFLRPTAGLACGTGNGVNYCWGCGH
ncbi:hypothetical protein OS12_24540 [Dickeya oryzae]